MMTKTKIDNDTITNIIDFIYDGTWAAADKISPNIATCAKNIITRMQFLFAPRDVSEYEIRGIFDKKFGCLEPAYTRYTRRAEKVIHTEIDIYCRTICEFTDEANDVVPMKPGFANRLVIIQSLNLSEIYNWCLAIMQANNRELVKFDDDESVRSAIVEPLLAKNLTLLSEGRLFYYTWQRLDDVTTKESLYERTTRLINEINVMFLIEKMSRLQRFKNTVDAANELAENVRIVMSR